MVHNQKPHLIGFINIQFAIQKKNIFILEVNPRGSRTIPFVAKSIGIPLAKIASKIMVGEKLSNFITKKCFIRLK